MSKMAPIYSATSRRLIDVDSCLNPLKMRKDLQSRWRFEFDFFVDDVIFGVGLGFFDHII